MSNSKNYDNIGKLEYIFIGRVNTNTIICEYPYEVEDNVSDHAKALFTKIQNSEKYNIYDNKMKINLNNGYYYYTVTNALIFFFGKFFNIINF